MPLPAAETRLRSRKPEQKEPPREPANTDVMGKIRACCPLAVCSDESLQKKAIMGVNLGALCRNVPSGIQSTIVAWLFSRFAVYSAGFDAFTHRNQKLI